MSQYVEVFPF